MKSLWEEVIEIKFAIIPQLSCVMRAAEQSHHWHRPLAHRRTALRWHRGTCALLGQAPGPSTAIPSFARRWVLLPHAVAASTNMSESGQKTSTNPFVKSTRLWYQGLQLKTYRQIVTFMRSYLSSTSWIQEMNWRALKRSLTDLFSSPWQKKKNHQVTIRLVTELEIGYF